MDDDWLLAPPTDVSRFGTRPPNRKWRRSKGTKGTWRMFASCPMATRWSPLGWTNCAFGARPLSRRSSWRKGPSRGVNDRGALDRSLGGGSRFQFWHLFAGFFAASQIEIPNKDLPTSAVSKQSNDCLSL